MALMTAFSAMTQSAIAQVTVNGGTANQDYTITANSGATLANLTVSGTVAHGLLYSVNVTGSLGTLHNTGTILNTNTASAFAAVASAIYNTGQIDTLENDNLISSVNAENILNAAGKIGTLTNTGTLTVTGSAGVGILNVGGGYIGTLNNSGTIKSSTVAIDNVSSGTINTLVNAGTVQATDTGVGQSIHVGTNHGDISANGIAILNGGNAANYHSVDGSGSTIGSIDNSGTITGSAFALLNVVDGVVGVITNSGLIAGNIENDAANNLVINGGTGTVFGTLTGYGGTIGTISNIASNVVFGTGNILLNDNVDLGGTSGITTFALNNTGAVLQVDNPLTISGNYTQGAAATLMIGVADGAVAQGSLSSDSGYGRLVVSGSAVIDSGSHITLQKLNTYGFAAGQRFVVVDAALAGTDYHADTLIYGIDGINAVVRGTVVDTATRSDLVISVVGVPTTTATTATTATTRNAIALLHGLASYSGIDDAKLLNLYNAALALNNGTAEEANKAGAQLGPVAQTQSIRVAALPTFDTLDIIGARVASLRLDQVAGSRGSDSVDTPSTRGVALAQTGVWGQAFGGHASQRERDEVNGYTANYAGLVLGVDRALNERWRAGGAFSYSNAAMYSTGSTTGDATHIDNYGFFGYASYTAPRWYANLSAGIASQHYTETRAIDFTGFSGSANGSFGGTQWVARGELGYPLALGGATLTPLASLTYAYLHQNAYTESSAEGAALRVGTAHATSVKTDIGAKLDQAFSTRYGELVPSVQLAWRHEYTHSKTTVDASFAADPLGETAFSTKGARPVSDSALLTAGVTVLRANNLSITAQYQMQAASGFLSQAGTLRLRQLF